MNHRMRILAAFLSFLLWDEANAQIKAWGSLYYEIVGFEVHIEGCAKNTRGDLVIPDEIDGFPVTKIRDNAFKDALITAISIPDSVTEIQEYAFLNASSLLSIAIPPKVTLGNFVFYNCALLTVVDWPESITVIPQGTFHGCSGLKKLELPDSVTEISGGAFYKSGLESITLPASVKTIRGLAFAECAELKSITIPSGTSTIEANAFTNSLYLTQVRIPERYHSESEAIRLGLTTAWPNGFLVSDAELTGPAESLEIRLAPVVTVKGVPGEVKTIDVAESADGPWKLWRIVIVATGGASEVDLDEGAARRFYRIRHSSSPKKSRG